ncbi:hypothetical protein KCP70_17610 [Salmonella enterica subsp. enterica]|nr:hypothetical protein KCP70_17610 [Salmonella enterica subsp. enterica]
MLGAAITEAPQSVSPRHGVLSPAAHGLSRTEALRDDGSPRSRPAAVVRTGRHRMRYRAGRNGMDVLRGALNA